MNTLSQSELFNSYVLLSVTCSSERSKAAVLSAAFVARSRSAKLVIFDKTDGEISEFLSQVSDIDVPIDLVHEDLTVGLLESIQSWLARTLVTSEIGSSSLVQVVAEDDWFGQVLPFNELNRELISMALPRVVFEESMATQIPQCTAIPQALTADQSRAVFGYQGAYADCSWHALTRGDVFRDYFQWLNSLPYCLPHHSSGMIWLALSRGQVEPLSGFVYVKDYSTRVDKLAVRSRYEQLYMSAGMRSVDLAADPSLFALGIVSLLFRERESNESIDLEMCLEAAINLYVGSYGWAIKDLGLREVLRRTSTNFLWHWIKSRFFGPLLRLRVADETEKLARMNDKRFREVWATSRKLLPTASSQLTSFYAESFPT